MNHAHSILKTKKKIKSGNERKLGITFS